MSAFIAPPNPIPFFIRPGIWLAEKITGKPMLAARLLTWYPRAAVGSGVLEALVAHHDRDVNERLLKLVRIQASYAAACPFCIDMNSFQAEQDNITHEELLALQGEMDLDRVSSFSQRERLAIQYARLISQTPLKFPADFINELKAEFKEREMVILASTAAQVNYWARLIQALGVPPAGFSDRCEIPHKS